MGCTSSNTAYKKETVAHTPIQFYLNDEEILRFTRELQFLQYTQDTILFTQGGPNLRFYIVAKGSVQIKSSGDNTDNENLLVTKDVGDCFGSAALDTVDKMHSTSAMAEAGSELFYLTKEKFIAMTNKKNMREVCQKIHDIFQKRLHILLKEVSFFSDLDNHELRTIAQLVTYITKDVGDIIINEGDFSNDMYIILEGLVSVTACGVDGHSIVLAELGAGEYFAELGLVLKMPRTATISIIEKALLLKLSKQSFDRFLKIDPKIKECFKKVAPVRLTEMIKKFKIPFFEWIPNDQINQIGNVVEVVTKKKGEVIFIEDDIGEEFFIIIHGAIQVIYKNEPLDVLTPGDYFGEVALVVDTNRTHTVKAIEQTTMLVMHKRDFDRFFQKGSVAYASVVVRITDMEAPLSAVLTIPFGLDTFRKHIKKEYAEENLDCWESVCEFKKDAKNDPDPVKRLNNAQSIVKMYIAQNADSQVNISDNQRQHIIKNVIEKGIASSDTFDVVEKEVLDLMTRGVYTRYKNSEDFKTLLKKVGDYHGKRSSIHEVKVHVPYII